MYCYTQKLSAATLIVLSKSKSAKSVALKSPKSKAKALVIAGYCAAVLVVLRAVRRRQTVQFCAVALFSTSSPPPCCRANKAHCKALQAAR